MGELVGTAANPDYNTALALYNNFSSFKTRSADPWYHWILDRFNSGIYTSAEYNQYHKWGFNITVVK
jgi:hypothetical protein